jgi:predicted nuclease with RNAse H fold
VSPDGGVWVGADPGGKNNFGLAILDTVGAPRSWCVGCVDDALDILGKVGAKPTGVGIDAPMWWSSGPSSDRMADQWLRRRYKLSGGQVQAANSLRGAALVQGALFLDSMRRRFPGVWATEVHPKALLAALGRPSWPDFCRRFELDTRDCATEHERDAVIAAVAAREGFESRWTHDLSAQRSESEQDPATYWLAPVRYFWPES